MAAGHRVSLMDSKAHQAAQQTRGGELYGDYSKHNLKLILGGYTSDPVSTWNLGQRQNSQQEIRDLSLIRDEIQ